MSLCAAAAAALTTGIVTVAASSQVTGGHSAVFNANDTITSPIPPTTTTPAIASAGPTVKATKFAGGDWPGN